jgi:Lon protease-like protein
MDGVALFPLNTVLFPGGDLPLRIFEPRYLSMVADCMKQQQPFGVVLISEGQEAGMAADFHEVGTLARIVDFDQLEDGSLGLACKGESRIRVNSFGVRADQLIIGDVTSLDDSGQTLSIELEERMEKITRFLREALHRQGNIPSFCSADGGTWENPEWISFQTAELLPLSPESRQLILEMSVQERLVEIGYVLGEYQL